MFIALLPDQLSQSQLLLFIFIVLAIDALIVLLGAGLAVLFVAFKAGKAILQLIDKTVNYVIYTILRLVEDILESPPLDKVPFLQWVLVGVKKAYDLFNGAQALIMAAVNVAVTLVAIALALLFVLALAALNLAALGVVIRYLV